MLCILMNDKNQIIIYLHFKLFIFNIQHIASQKFFVCGKLSLRQATRAAAATSQTRPGIFRLI